MPVLMAPVSGWRMLSGLKVRRQLGGDGRTPLPPGPELLRVRGQGQTHQEHEQKLLQDIYKLNPHFLKLPVGFRCEEQS